MSELVRRGDGHATDATRTTPLEVPNAFFEASEVVSLDDEPVTWPRGATPPKHLPHFCFPIHLLTRLCEGGNDAVRHTFSFTEQARAPFA